MNPAFELIAANLGMSWQNIILFVLMLGCFVFYAADVRLGLLLQFVCSSLCTLWFYVAEYDYKFAIVISLIMVTLLSLSLLFNPTGRATGGLA